MTSSNYLMSINEVVTADNKIYPVSPFCSQQTFDDATKFQFKKNDVIVASYPKCGTTWLTTIMWHMHHKMAPFPDNQTIQNLVLYCEISGRQKLLRHQEKGNALFYTHLGGHLFPIAAHGKHVIILRNPKDVCVSMFHYFRNMVPVYTFHAAFNEFFESFIAGRVHYGDYFEYVTSWVTCAEEDNALIVTYEDLKVRSCAVDINIRVNTLAQMP